MNGLDLRKTSTPSELFSPIFQLLLEDGRNCHYVYSSNSHLDVIRILTHGPSLDGVYLPSNTGEVQSRALSW